jgi:hypothetical protein
MLTKAHQDSSQVTFCYLKKLNFNIIVQLKFI